MTYQHLDKYPTPQGFQYRLKGRCHLTAKIVAASMTANGWSVEKAAANYNIPTEAVLECLAYYRKLLEARGVS